MVCFNSSSLYDRELKIFLLTCCHHDFSSEVYIATFLVISLHLVYGMTLAKSWEAFSVMVEKHFLLYSVKKCEMYKQFAAVCLQRAVVKVLPEMYLKFFKMFCIVEIRFDSNRKGAYILTRDIN